MGRFAGWNSSPRIKGKLQASLYWMRKERKRKTAPPPPPPPPPPSDPFWDLVVLHVKADDNYDSSTIYTYGPNGGSKSIGPTGAKFGNAIVSPGIGGYRSWNVATDKQPSPANLTVEAFVSLRDQTFSAPIHRKIFINSQVSVPLLGFQYLSGEMRLVSIPANGSFMITANVLFPTDGTVTHVALEKKGNLWYLYQDGKVVGTATNAGNAWSANSKMYAAGDENSTAAFNGSVDELRVTYAARYNGQEFEVPTEPYPTTGPDTQWDNVRLLYTFEDAEMMDKGPLKRGSPGASAGGLLGVGNDGGKFGDGYLLLDPGPKGRTIVTLPEDSLGTGNWTIEGFINLPVAHAGFKKLFTFRNSGAYLYLSAGALGMEFFHAPDGGWRRTVTPSTLVVGAAFHHFAFVRAGAALTLYLNGTPVGTPAVTTGVDFGAEGPTMWFGDPASNAGTCKLDQFRFTKGVARYTSAFNPPPSLFPTTGPA